jgi:ferredoxin-type protein NapH
MGLYLFIARILPLNANIEKAPKKKSVWSAAKIARWRFWVQAGFLLAWLDPLMIRMHSFCGPVFHCYSCPLATFACPIGVLANFSAIHAIPFVLLGMLLILGASIGSFICGWVCPFGFLQDLIAKIPTPKFTLPVWTGYFRYVVLAAFVLVIPYLWGESHPLFFCSLCPAGALEGALPNAAKQALAHDPVTWPNAAKLTILGVLLAAMLFTWRPWCTLFCPLGAIYSIFNHVSFLFLRFHPNRCIDCADCRSLCLDGGDAERRIDSLRCVRCMECSRCRAVTIETVFSAPPPPKAKETPQEQSVSS